MDEEYLSANAKEQYKDSPSKCYQAAKKVVTDMGGRIEKEDKGRMLFSSNRFTLQRSAIATGSKYNASATQINEDHKIYIQVNKSPKGCAVKFKKYRVWVNNVEYEKLYDHHIKPKVFNPFFANLKSELKGDIL